jgi:hypothetical protein
VGHPSNSGPPGDRKGEMKKSLIFVLAVMSMMLGCGDRFVTVPIARSATLTASWTEFRPAQPLLWSEPQQEICFHIDSPHEISSELTIIGPNGERFVPDVELIADSGRVLVMDTHGFLPDKMVYQLRAKPSDVAVIKAVRIRSSSPLRITNLVWRGYDPAEVKR